MTSWWAMRSPLNFRHFNFRGPDVERLVKGRERIYLDRFWNEFSANPKAIDEASRRHYAKLYARRGAMCSRTTELPKGRSSSRGASEEPIDDPMVSPEVFPRARGVKLQVLQLQSSLATPRCRLASVPPWSA